MEEILRENEYIVRATKYLADRKGVDNKTLAAASGRSLRTINYIFARQRGAGKKTAVKLAAYFGLSYANMLSLGAWIIAGKDPAQWQVRPDVSQLGDYAPFFAEAANKALTKRKQEATAVTGDNIVATELPAIRRRVPVISFVQAGAFTDAAEFSPSDIDEWVECVSPVSKNAFALRVQGPSMEPEFRAGEIIVIDPDRRCDSGDYVVAGNGDSEATFKQYYLDGTKQFLVPLNEDWGKPMEMTGQNWRLIGRVVEKIKRY